MIVIVTLTNLLEIFALYLGNWQVIGMIFTCYILLLRCVSNEVYGRIWNSIKPSPNWLSASMIGFILLVVREMLLIPLDYVVTWMPGSFLWEQTFTWLYASHFWSILLYFGLFLFAWHKMNNMYPAALLTMFALGSIELTFIPQHLIVFNTFLGEWYLPFIAVMMLFIVEYRHYTILNKRKMLLWFLGGVASQYIIIPLIPYSISQYSSELVTWVINTNLLPHPPMITWIYAIFQTCIKIFYLLGFTFIRLKERS